MMSFRGDRFASLALPTAALWFIDEIAEAIALLVVTDHLTFVVA